MPDRIHERWCCLICNTFGEGGEDLFGHAMDFHHNDTPQMRHRCFCLDDFDDIYGFYHHFRANHVKYSFICLKCLRIYDSWIVARDHGVHCQSTLTNGH